MRIRLATSWILEAILPKSERPGCLGFRSTLRGTQSPAHSKEIAGNAVHSNFSAVTTSNL
jgi:hypothetical protein